MDSQCDANDARTAATNALAPADEGLLREYLWLSHGHGGVYGDDGEMQCGQCRPVWDYKRAPLGDVIRAASEARGTVNLDTLAAPSLVSRLRAYVQHKRECASQVYCAVCRNRRGVCEHRRENPHPWTPRPCDCGLADLLGPSQEAK